MNDTRDGKTDKISDRAAWGISNEKMSQKMIMDFRRTISGLTDRGFDNDFIWETIDHVVIPSMRTIRGHFKDRSTNQKPDKLAFDIAVTRTMFAYLIQMQRALCHVLREDVEFLKTVSPNYLKDLEATNVSTASILFQGYFLGQASNAQRPEDFLNMMSQRHSARMSEIGKKKKGVITSPASKAILLAFDYGHMTGSKVRRFFDGSPTLDEIDVDIELNDTRDVRTYRFLGIDESKDTELTEAEIDVRVSQLKKNYSARN